MYRVGQVEPIPIEQDLEGIAVGVRLEQLTDLFANLRW